MMLSQISQICAIFSIFSYAPNLIATNGPVRAYRTAMNLASMGWEVPAAALRHKKAIIATSPAHWLNLASHLYWQPPGASHQDKHGNQLVIHWLFNLLMSPTMAYMPNSDSPAARFLSNNKNCARVCATEPFLSIIATSLLGPIAQLVRASDS